MLFVSTNIPNTGDVVISNVRVVTGRVWENDAEFVIPPGNEFVEIHVLNQHDNFEVFNNATPDPGGEMYIEFTINGFSFGAEITEEDDEPQVFAPTPVGARPEVTPAPTATNDDNGMPTWVIILIVAGAVVVVGAIAFVVVKGKGKK
jgi:hypothetical protein